ncbi:hypothetical protein D7030_00665 [Flavobacteriaceae bacterium AU392]|nr:hypothetical protein D1817_12065 [Flavobacteriaceae bacterium]RKM86844.1 hypothetical protein D7030_00665 [Flavobacteriaceae bacterium AU392]
MKTKFFALSFLFITLFSCSNSDDVIQEIPAPVLLWSLDNTANNIISNDFTSRLITWEFNPNNLMLTVVNGNTDDSIFDGLDSDVYAFDIREIDEGSFLFINGEEYGGIEISTEQRLVIDRNATSDGGDDTMEDRFVLTFTRIN